MTYDYFTDRFGLIANAHVKQEELEKVLSEFEGVSLDHAVDEIYIVHVPEGKLEEVMDKFKREYSNLAGEVYEIPKRNILLL